MSKASGPLGGASTADASADASGSARGSTRLPWGLRTRSVEVATGLALFLFGLVVVADSARIGMGWGPDGPEAGFYPFYVGLILCATSAAIALIQLRPSAGAVVIFIDRARLARVLAVFIPSTAFVVGLLFLGTYVSSALFLAGFMRWQGRFAWRVAVPIALLVPAALFLSFEVWFKVPLPKGPIEAWLEY